LVESTQIRWFSRRSGGGGWSGRAIAQQRPRFSELGINGLFDYCYNEIAVEAARRGPMGQIKGLSSKRERWATALSLNEQGQKESRQRKISLVRKSYSL
jgi:hypothetical protein